MSVLAIDQGTTSTKAFVLSPEGRFDFVGARRHRQILPGAGLVEHDADELLAGIESLIDEALAQDSSIAGLALANQGETVVAWDRVSGRPVHSAIVWQDQRTQARLDAMSEAEREQITEISGLPPDAYFSASKLSWLLDEVPQTRMLAAEGRLGLATSDAFFIDRLTGRYVTDATTASRTSLMDLRAPSWSEALCRLFGVPSILLPEIVRTTGPLGTFERGGRTLPLVASVVDQQAALFGHGCRKAGDLKITFGTGTFALAVTGGLPRPVPKGLVPTIAWHCHGEEPLYALDGGDYTAAAAVEWAVSIGLGKAPEEFEAGGEISMLERGLVFVPTLAGLAAPYWDRGAAGAFLGLTQSTTAADMRRAVLEGVALRAVELIECLTGGASIDAVSADGGLVRNRGFVQFLADALGHPVLLREHADLTALGAAELGYIGLGRAVPDRAAEGTLRVLPSERSGALKAARHHFGTAIGAVRSWSARA